PARRQRPRAGAAFRSGDARAADQRARERDPARDGRRSARGTGLLAACAQHGGLDARPRGGLAMRMRARRREMETMSLSFIDCICCGFGAVILLLVITKLFEPIRIEESRTQLEQ